MTLKVYISMIQKKKKLTLLAKNSIKKEIIERHILDSAQIIDFVDLNSNTTSDLGTGAVCRD